MMPLDESLACGNFPNRSVHVNVAGKVQIYTTASDLGPGLNLLGLSIQDREAFNHGHFTGFDPIAIKISLQTASAADVRRTELLTFCRFRKRLCGDFGKREISHRKGEAGLGRHFNKVPARDDAGEKIVYQIAHGSYSSPKGWTSK